MDEVAAALDNNVFCSGRELGEPSLELGAQAVVGRAGDDPPGPGREYDERHGGQRASTSKFAGRRQEIQTLAVTATLVLEEVSPVPGVHELGQSIGLRLVGGIDEDHSSHSLRVLSGVEANRQPTDRVADENIGGLGPHGDQDTFKVFDCTTQGVLARCAVALSQARPVVGAHTSKRGNVIYNLCPAGPRLAETILQHDRHATLPVTVDAKSVATDVHEPAGRDQPAALRAAPPAPESTPLKRADWRRREHAEKEKREEAERAEDDCAASHRDRFSRPDTRRSRFQPGRGESPA